MARLLLAAPEQRMAELKTEPLLSVDLRMRTRRMCLSCSTNTILRMLTVVDEEKRPIGTVTVDDVVSRLVKK